MFRHPAIHKTFSHKLSDIIMGNLDAGFSVTHALRHDKSYARSNEISFVMLSSIEEYRADRFAREGGAPRFPRMLTSTSLSA